MTDWIPFVSQVKSLVQVISGDSEGALQTQINFSKRCFIVSQVRSIVEAVTDGSEAALSTQREFLHNTNGLVNGIPVVGHVKGVVHYLVGDSSDGDDAMKAASRTTGALAFGLLGFAGGGPPVAIAGGIIGAAGTDGVISGIETAIKGTTTVNGILQELSDLYDDPTDAGKWFDTAFTLAADGATGYFGGTAYENTPGCAIRAFRHNRGALADNIGTTAAGDMIELGNRMRKMRKIYKLEDNKKTPHVMSLLKDKITGKLYEGHNKQIRDLCKKKVNRGEVFVDDANKVYDYPGGRNTLTNFQQGQPEVAREIANRNPTSCAEHAAYDQLFTDNPNANTENTWVMTARLDKKGNIRVFMRCKNCKAYAMGAAPGDFSDGFLIPEHPGPLDEQVRQLATKKAVCGVCGCALISTIEPSKEKKT